MTDYSRNHLIIRSLYEKVLHKSFVRIRRRQCQKSCREKPSVCSVTKKKIIFWLSLIAGSVGLWFFESFFAYALIFNGYGEGVFLLVPFWALLPFWIVMAWVYRRYVREGDVQKIMDSKLSINGEWPKLEGKRLQEMICHEMYFEGELEELANVTSLKVGGEWLELYFDGDVIFWRMAKAPTEKGEIVEHDSYFKLTDVADKFSLKGNVIKRLDVQYIENGVEVVFTFGGGKSMIFSSINDISSYRMAMREG